MKDLEQENNKLLVIIGPTAVGKTKLSIEMAKRFNGEIISGDSMQVYKGMDIGTAKITRDEKEGIPHFLLDIKAPNESFSAADFQELANQAIADIQKRGKLPIIVGGTGLYIQSVIYDYQFTEAPSNIEYRKSLESIVETDGIDPLIEKLRSIDPKSAERIHPNNVRRIIRALEIYYCTGITMSDQLDKQSSELKYNTALIGLTMNREALYQRINHRVDIMIEQGLIEEVKSFYEQGLRDCQSIQAIGYKELYDYFAGKLTLDESIEALKQNSRRYAKRQLTWFRNKMDVQWYEMQEQRNNSSVSEEISTYIAGKLSLRANM